MEENYSGWLQNIFLDTKKNIQVAKMCPGLMKLKFLPKHTDGRVRIWLHYQQDPACHVLTDQVSRASLIVWECFLVLNHIIHSWPQFAHLLIAASNMIMHHVKVSWNWFHKYANELSDCHWPAQAPDLNPTEQHWDTIEWDTSWEICRNYNHVNMDFNFNLMFSKWCWIHAARNYCIYGHMNNLCINLFIFSFL